MRTRRWWAVVALFYATTGWAGEVLTEGAIIEIAKAAAMKPGAIRAMMPKGEFTLVFVNPEGGVVTDEESARAEQLALACKDRKSDECKAERAYQDEWEPIFRFRIDLCVKRKTDGQVVCLVVYLPDSDASKKLLRTFATTKQPSLSVYFDDVVEMKGRERLQISFTTQPPDKTPRVPKGFTLLPGTSPPAK